MPCRTLFVTLVVISCLEANATLEREKALPLNGGAFLFAFIFGQKILICGRTSIEVRLP